MKEYIELAKKGSLADFISKYDCPFLLQITEQELQSNKMNRTIISKIEDFNISKEINKIYPLIKSEKNKFKGLIIIGRDQNQDIIIENPKISKSHAYFKLSKEKIFLRDTGSSNGTFLNKVKLEPLKDYEVRPNDIISFANISFRFIDNVSAYYTLKLL
jgi:pSer/pThr/pTyr-binding forkhead associated (FHA) protein